MCPISSEGVTPPSSLLLAHVPLPLGSPLLRFLASFGESLQVVLSPCCPRELPDVISENLSLDAGSRIPAVPPCARTCFFPGGVGLPQAKVGSASRVCPTNYDSSQGPCFEIADIPSCSGLQVCSPPRSSLPLRILPQGSRGFYVRAYRVHYHAPDMLAVRIQAIDGTRSHTLLDSQPCRLLTSLHGHYPASSLIRSSPPLSGASVLSASRVHRLCFLPLHRRPGSQVPYESPNESHASYTPDTAWPVGRSPPCSS